MLLSDFDYALPDELIARYPTPERRASRLLVVGDGLEDARFAELPAWLRAGDLLVFNDTRVLSARLHGRKPSGGRAEILVERVLSDTTALAQVRASKSPKPGSAIVVGDGLEVEVSGRQDEFFELEFPVPVRDVLDRYGEIPLPPYLGRAATPVDSDRYQTVYARNDGAVAAPTAGLHFDEAMLDETRAMGVGHGWVTLHVGAGTFQPLRAERVADNQLHAEYIEVGAAVCDLVADTRGSGGRVIAVGTTAVRALETAAAGGGPQPFSGDTDIFIYPGFRFRAVDAIVTNFHLPRSSLLMLVSAFAGRERVLAAYRHAVAERYRFFSYGDAMLLMPASP